MTIEEGDACRKSLQDFDIIVRCPASLLFFGEYSAVRNHPAVVMAIPLFVELGADLINSQEISFEVAYPKPRLSYQELGKFSGQQKLAFHRGLVGDPELDSRMKNKLKPVLGSKGLKVRVISEIPPSCGLGSSGALCASLSIAIHVLLKNVSSGEIRDSLTEHLEEIAYNNVFDRVFRFAWALEDAIHRPSSGVAPFASLVGSPDSLPLIYCSTIKKRKRIYEGIRLSELQRINQESLKSFLWNECEFAALYSGQSRSDLTSVNVQKALEEVENRVDKTVARFAEGLGNRSFDDSFRLLSIFSRKHENAYNYLLRNLWSTFGLMTLISISNMLTKHRRDIITMTNAAQDLLSFLGMSTDRVDEISHIAKTHKLGCKLLGSGKGGDVLLVGGTNEEKTLKKLINQSQFTTLGDKPVFHLLSSDIKPAHRAVPPARVLRYQPKRDITVERHAINPKMPMKDKVRIAVAALEWRELDKEGKFNKSDLDKRMKEICDLLVEYINKNVDLIIFPEFTVPVEAIENIRQLVDKNERITVIAGSHYYKDKNKYFNRCPIITPGDIIYQDKIKQSPKEPVSITESDVVWMVEGTNVGNICVMICASFREFVKNLAATRNRRRIDFLIVPSCNRDVKTFDKHAERLCYDYFTHIVIANVYDFGGSAVYGPMHRRRRIRAIHANQKSLIVEIDIKEFERAWNCRQSNKYKMPEKCRPEQVTK